MKNHYHDKSHINDRLSTTQTSKLITWIILTIALLNTGGCIPSIEQSKQLDFATSQSPNPVLASTSRTTITPIDEPIRDEVLDDYNESARLAIRQHLAIVLREDRAFESDWREKQLREIMNAVLLRDAQTHNYFSGAMRLVFATPVNHSVDVGVTRHGWQNQMMYNIFKIRGIAINIQFTSDDEDFLWRIGKPYSIADSTKAILKSTFAGDRYRINLLDTIMSGRRIPDRDISLQGNYAAGGFLFLNPQDVRRWANLRQLNADDVVESIAAHEIAHDILLQTGRHRILEDLFEANQQSPIAVGEFATLCYSALELIEIFADSVEIMTSQAAVHRVAHRIIRRHDVTGLKNFNGIEQRTTPHDASANLMLALLRREEKLLGIKNNRAKIDWIRAHRIANPAWLRQYFRPYLDTVLTRGAIDRIQRSYMDHTKEILQMTNKRKIFSSYLDVVDSRTSQ